MATIRRNDLKSGTSYRIVVKVKSPRTNKLETHSKTWKVPKDMTEQEIQLKIKELACEFEKQEKQKETRFQMNNKSITFCTFIDEWL